jgi:hypothetical protein
MTVLGHYFLLLLAAILLLLWAASWVYAPSARAKHWLLATGALFVPFSFAMVWWWSWPLTAISLLANPWNELEFVVVVCLSASLLASYIRRLSQIPFQQPIKMEWSRYVLVSSAIFMMARLASSFPWPTLFTISAILLIIALIGAVTIRSRQLALAQLASIGLTIVITSVIGLIATQLVPALNHGLGISKWHIAWIWPQLLALASIAAAWPVLSMWWLDQPFMRSAPK